MSHGVRSFVNHRNKLLSKLKIKLDGLPVTGISGISRTVIEECIEASVGLYWSCQVLWWMTGWQWLGLITLPTSHCTIFDFAAPPHWWRLLYLLFFLTQEMGKSEIFRLQDGVMLNHCERDYFSQKILRVVFMARVQKRLPSVPLGALSREFS